MTAIRYYFTNTASAISPAFAAWDLGTAGAIRRKMSTTVPGVSQTITRNNNSISDQNIFGGRQLISDPLSIDSFPGGTVKSQMRSLENNAADNFVPQIIIRTFSPDGLTLRDIVCDFDNSAISNEFPTGTSSNRKYPRNWSGSGAELLVSPNYQIGDVIVVEYGVRTFGTTANAFNLFATANAASDLPEDETTTTNLNAWIEFDFFDPNPTPVGYPAGAGTGLSVSKRWTPRRRTWTPRV